MLFLASAAVQAAGDAERGAILANTCLGCHGIPGYRNAYPNYRVPKLGGQKMDYLVVALQGYQADTRNHPTMAAQSDTLSAQDMRDIAAYFSGQGEAQTGELVTDGNAARGKEKVAVCTACHGEAGISPAPNWPNLAGQHKDYLVHSIKQYRDGGRADPVMMGQVVNLTDQDIKDIAAFYSKQAGLFTASYAN
jgi:cytochrome c553